MTVHKSIKRKPILQTITKKIKKDVEAAQHDFCHISVNIDMFLSIIRYLQSYNRSQLSPELPII